MNIQWMTHCRLQLTPPLSPMLQCSVHSTSYNVISYYWQPLPLWRSMYWTLNPFIWSEQNISLKMDTCLFFSVHNVCFSCPMREYKFLILDFLSQKKKIIFELKYSEQQRHDNEGLEKFGFSFFSVFIFMIPQPEFCRTHEKRVPRWSVSSVTPWFCTFSVVGGILIYRGSSPWYSWISSRVICGLLLLTFSPQLLQPAGLRYNCLDECFHNIRRGPLLARAFSLSKCLVC